MEGKLRAVILEDDAADAELMAGELRRSGYELSWDRVQTADELRANLQIPPDVVLADFKLPRFTALDALEITRALHPDLPFIVVTGAVGEETAAECIKRGADDYLLKDRLVRLGPAVAQAIAHRRAEAAYRSTRERLELVLAASPLPILVLDTAGRVLLWDGAAERVFGWRSSEVLGGFAPFLEPGDAATFGGVLLRVLPTGPGGPAGASHVRGRRKDGSVLDLDVHCAAIPDVQGGAVGIVAILDDVTEERAAARRLKRLDTAITHAAEAVVITDAAGTITYVNAAFEAVTGYDSHEAVGRNPRFLRSGRHDEAFYRDLWNTILGGAVWRGRLINRGKDGRQYHEQQTIAPIVDATGQSVGFVGIGRDVTQEVEMEERLRQAQKMEAVGELAGGVAHDFNNTLQVISGYTEVLRTRTRGLGKEIDTFLEQLARATDNGGRLTHQLLAFSRKQTLDMRPLDLNGVVEQLLKMIRRVIGANVALEFRGGTDLPSVNADSVQLEQVLLNLCLNARDAMPGGGSLTLGTELVAVDRVFCATRPWARPGSYVRLSVADTGVGMDETTRRRVFEPFFTTKEPGKGTGLGLAVAYGIVKQHGGMIDAYSEPGLGSTFSVYLPPYAGPAEPLPAANPVQEAPGGTEGVLFADDDEAIRTLISEVLRTAGYRVFVAKDGPGATEVIRLHGGEIAVAVLDAVMPGMSGPELLDALREAVPGLPVLFCSGYSPMTHQTDYLRDRGVPLIQKPYGLPQLLRAVRSLLDAPAAGSGKVGP